MHETHDADVQDAMFTARRRVALLAIDMMEGEPTTARRAILRALDELGYTAPPSSIEMLRLHVEAIRRARAGLPWRQMQAASVGLAREYPAALYASLSPRELAQPLDAVNGVGPITGRVCNE